MQRWTRFVLRFRWPVLALWLVVLLAGGYSSGKLNSLLSNTFTMPGTDSERARTILQHAYGDRSDGASTVVFQVRDARDPATRARLQAVLVRAAKAIPTGEARPLARDGDLRHEPGAADRARDRDRLLAAGRLSLPGRTGEERIGRRSDRSDDEDGGTRGGLLRRDGRDRVGAAPVHALAVHALDGNRRL